jgi:hypothetical protein
MSRYVCRSRSAHRDPLVTPLACVCIYTYIQRIYTYIQHKYICKYITLCMSLKVCASLPAPTMAVMYFIKPLPVKCMYIYVHNIRAYITSQVCHLMYVAQGLRIFPSAHHGRNVLHKTLASQTFDHFKRLCQCILNGMKRILALLFASVFRCLAHARDEVPQLHVCIYIYVCVCVCVCMYVCHFCFSVSRPCARRSPTTACIYVCMYVSVFQCFAHARNEVPQPHVCMYVCMYVCVYIRSYEYILYVCTYEYTVYAPAICGTLDYFRFPVFHPNTHTHRRTFIYTYLYT